MNGQNRGHQANKLMELFQEVANHNPDDIDQPDLNQHDSEKLHEEYIELDILNLPPRREVHGNKKRKYSFSLARPIIRLTFVFLIMIMILILFFYQNLNQIVTFFYLN